MPITAFAYIALGAVFIALYNVYTKRGQSADWKSRSSLLAALHLGIAALLLLATSFATGGPRYEPTVFWPIAVTGTLNIGIMLGKMRARALEDVSLVAPIDSTTPAAVIVTSMVILGEYPSRLGWAGIWLVTFGTYVLNIAEVRAALDARVLGSATANGGAIGAMGFRETILVYLAPFTAMKRSIGVRWAFFAVALSTISLNYDGLVARRADIGFGLACVCVIAATGNAVIAVARGEHRGVSPGDAIRRTSLLAAFFAAGNYVTNLAYLESIVPYVGALKRLQIPLTIVLAYLILGERKSFKDRIVGGVIMAVGAILIGLG